jgi:hypothetical protein
MKKLISLLALILSVCVTSVAQTSVVKENVEYCELTTDTKWIKSKSKVFIDYGDGDEKLVDDQGKEVLFRFFSRRRPELYAW